MCSKKQKKDWSFIKFSGFDYKFRPDSYFLTGSDPLSTLLSKITGTKRRNVIKKAFLNNEPIPASLLDSTLSEELRNMVSGIHPSCMGGEYLPDFDSGETEIARIELDSTTSDVISVRARWEENRYWYFVVDEYGSDFIVPVESSEEPFTFREMIEFLNGTDLADASFKGLATMFAATNIDCGSSVEEMKGFQSLSSDVYPELSEYYGRYISKYLSQFKHKSAGDSAENNS